jgi:hypothetical protein
MNVYTSSSKVPSESQLMKDRQLMIKHNDLQSYPAIVVNLSCTDFRLYFELLPSNALLFSA